MTALAGNFTVVGVEAGAMLDEAERGLVIGEGRCFKPGADDEVVMGQRLAEFLGLSVVACGAFPVVRYLVHSGGVPVYGETA